MQKIIFTAVLCCANMLLGADARYVMHPGGTVACAPQCKLSVCAYPGGWRGKSAVQTGLGEPDAKGTAQWSLVRAKKTFAHGRTTLFRAADGKVHARFEVEMTADFDSAGLTIVSSLPAEPFIGASWEDSHGTTVKVPEKIGSIALARGKMNWFAIRKSSGDTHLRVSIPGGGEVLFEDGRNWGPNLTLRITIAPPGRLPKGAQYSREIVFDEPGEFELGKLVSIRAGEDFVPFEFRKRIVSGSALDFTSQKFLDAPAGQYGWIRNVAGHFECEKRPGRRLRFWGANLCGGAPVVPHETALAYLDALARTGYNTIRIHNSERQFLQGSTDGLTLNEENMERFDFLFAEGKKRGFYFTTDLFIQRKAPWRALGIEKDGECPWGMMKALILVHDGAYANWEAFTRNLLSRRNRYTGLTYAEDPAMAFLSLINEGSCTWMSDAFNDPLVRARWKSWLAEKRAANPKFHPEAPADCAGVRISQSDKTFAVLDLFIAEHERAFCRKATAFIRSLGSQALLTDWNCGPWMPEMLQVLTDELDYSDRHFYVDHPVFVRAGGIYSHSPNISPVLTPNAHPAAAKSFARVAGRPLTVSEWNHCWPSPYRAIGGLMTGAFACLRDWDALWHFNYAVTAAHSEDGGGLCDQFTIANDPSMIFTARMGALLYMRQEIAPRDEGAEFRPSDLKDGAVTFGCTSAGHESMAVVTERSAGGFACAGETLSAGALTARIADYPATVFVSALEGSSLAEARRMVLFHLTDVQIDGCKFSDDAYTTLMDWRGNRPLVRKGAAEIALKLAHPQDYAVWALETDGSRACRVPSRVEDGKLCFTARITPPQAHFVYEIRHVIGR